MLSSACPGWVCYAEKTHGRPLIDYISNTRSPQQIMGSLVKYYLPQYLANINSHQDYRDLRGDQIFHCSLMPCYDKKLEASRQQFYYGEDFAGKDNDDRCREVDCVLSSVELKQMLFDCGFSDFSSLPESLGSEIMQYPDAQLFNSYFIESSNDANDIATTVESFGTSGSSSGGYLEFTLHYSMKELFPECSDWSIQVESSRSPDYEIYHAVDSATGQVKLSFAKAYGFRHIQNIVRRIQPKQPQQQQQLLASRKSQLHFVEVMACPSGCVNGGGQLRPSLETVDEGAENLGQSATSVRGMKQFVGKVEAVYRQGPLRHPTDNPLLPTIYNEWLLNSTANIKRFMQTDYEDIKHNSGGDGGDSGNSGQPGIDW